MNRHLILTLLGDDRPGLVETLSTLVSHHEGNWLESSMSRLAGKFAGVVRVTVPESHLDALEAKLAAIVDLKVVVDHLDTPAEAAGADAGPLLRFTLVCHDRIGIVSEVSGVFARHGVNVEKFSSRVSSAPMSSESLFNAEAELSLPAGLDPDTLKQALERLSPDLIADISLDTVR